MGTETDDYQNKENGKTEKAKRRAKKLRILT